MIQGPDQFALALRRLLEAQLARAGQLADLLVRERQALESGQAADLDEVTSAKPGLLSELEQLGSEQRALLEQLEFESSPSGLRLALSWCDRNGVLEQLQQDVIERISQCRERNGQNGLMVQHRIGYVRRALGALSGGDNSDALTYGRDGRQHGGLPSRLLASG